MAVKLCVRNKLLASGLSDCFLICHNNKKLGSATLRFTQLNFAKLRSIWILLCYAKLYFSRLRWTIPIKTSVSSTVHRITLLCLDVTMLCLAPPYFGMLICARLSCAVLGCYCATLVYTQVCITIPGSDRMQLCFAPLHFAVLNFSELCVTKLSSVRILLCYAWLLLS